MSSLVGNCSWDVYPDRWFPEVPNGRPSAKKMLALSEDIKYAVNSCASCPAKKDCLIEGMKEENLPHGIWGGLLAGERIKSLGHKKEDFSPNSDKGLAVAFYMRMEPWLEW